MTMDLQIAECVDTLITNNIFYRNNSENTVLFAPDDGAISTLRIVNNIVYSPDTPANQWITDGVSNYTLAQAVTNGWAEDISAVDPTVSASRPYPLTPITGATDLGAAFDDGLDIASVWTEAVVLKQQTGSWQFGAFVQ